ncbi:MAG: rod shape-determining protein MreC [Candidatus Limnocylindrales bacterium]
MTQSKASRTARRRAIVFAVLIALCLLLLGASKTAPMVQFRQGITFALSPIQSALAGATRSVTSVVSTIAEIERLRRDNEALQSRVQQLLADKQRLESVRIQNEQLTALLGVKSSLDFETLAAEVIGRQTSQFERTVTLDRGTSDGVRIGDPVLAGEGALVGSIITAGSNSSICLLLTDTRSTVTGLIETSRATGEVHGRLSTILSMTNIPSTDTVVVDDRVVTAGLDLGDGVRSPYPRGVLIGRIVDISSELNAIVQSALIQPAAGMEKLEYVLVITDFESTPTPDPSASGSPDPGASPGVSITPSPSASSPTR